MTTECWLQISAGQGPAECAWAVVQVLDRIREEAHASGLDLSIVEMTPGPHSGTAQSALIRLTGAHSLIEFVSGWRGTVQWIARSPFRPEHKRKNWFVGIEVLEAPPENRFNMHDVKIETMRASGPGGQHVNRTESAVRVTHVPTGIQASASEERSQHRNRKLALARLAGKLKALEIRKQDETKDKRWRAHQQLQRGNPVRVLFQGDTDHRCGQ